MFLPLETLLSVIPRDVRIYPRNNASGHKNGESCSSRILDARFLSIDKREEAKNETLDCNEGCQVARLQVHGKMDENINFAEQVYIVNVFVQKLFRGYGETIHCETAEISTREPFDEDVS